MKYTTVPFVLADDPLVYNDTRRCVRPKYDKKDGTTKYALEPIENIELPTKLVDVANKRLVSPICEKIRAPYLPGKYWYDKENELQSIEHNEVGPLPPGLRIQIYSIIDPVNRRTVYMLERTNNKYKEWKRIIITHHLSELMPFLPHIVDELDMEDDNREMMNLDDTCLIM